MKSILVNDTFDNTEDGKSYGSINSFQHNNINDLNDLNDLNNLNNIDNFRNLIKNLHEQITVLTGDMKFLRKDSLNKSAIINKLISVTHNFPNTPTPKDYLDWISDTTSHGNDISKYNEAVLDDENNRNIHNTEVGKINTTQISEILHGLMATPIKNSEECRQEHKQERYHYFPPIEEDFYDSNTNSTISVHTNDSSYKDVSNIISMLPIDESSLLSAENMIVGDDMEIVNEHFKMNSVYTKLLEKEAVWKKGTTLIIGDSLLYGLDEKKLKNMKVRIHPGSSVGDMYYNIFPLHRKEPTNIILHAGTSNATSENSVEIVEKLFNLKDFICSTLPNCKIIFSGLINRYDDAKAQLTVNRVNEKMSEKGMYVINNSNIVRSHLGKKGLHMNPHGTGKLAINIINFLKSL